MVDFEPFRQARKFSPSSVSQNSQALNKVQFQKYKSHFCIAKSPRERRRRVSKNDIQVVKQFLQTSAGYYETVFFRQTCQP